MIRRIAFFVLSLPFLFTPAKAHNVSIHPVNVGLNVETQEVRVRIETASEYWLLHILGTVVPPPATDWPDPYQQISAKIIGDSFSLYLDGHRLFPSELICRYIEEPLNLSPPRVRFDLTYSLDSKGATLSGRSQFFADEYKRHQQQGGGGPGREEYVTVLTVSGKKRSTIEIPFEDPEFSFPFSQVIKTSPEYAIESFKNAVIGFFGNPFLPLYVLIGLVIIRMWDKKRHFIEILSWSSVLVYLSCTFLVPFSPIIAYRPLLLWTMLALLAFPSAVMPTLKYVGLGVFLVLGPLLLPGVLTNGMSLLPAAAENSWIVKPFYLVGTFCSGVVIIIIAKFIFMNYKRRLIRLHESVSESIFLSHLRAFCGFVLFISLMQIIRIGMGR